MIRAAAAIALLATLAAVLGGRVGLGSRTPGGVGGAGGARSKTHTEEAARWADQTELRPLLFREPIPRGRLALGTLGNRLVAAEARHSVLVVGPTQSGKTSGLAVPAILEWEGPVLAVSVKTDLLRNTINWRRNLGRAWIYDPAEVTGLPASFWTPLAAAMTWTGARRTASALTDVARSSAGTLTDGDFWYSTAAKLLAPLLHAAALSGRTMADVVRWVDDQETIEVLDALESAGADDAMRAAHATWRRDERQRSAVYTTAETVVDVFADPAVARSADPRACAITAGRLWPSLGSPGEIQIEPACLPGSMDTIYLCAPVTEQRRLRPLFATLVNQVVTAAFEMSNRNGAPLDPPLLVVLDEAANIAPVAELDELAATAAGHGVQLVTVWQDFSQISARYGPRAGTVVNNHRAKLFLSGIADPNTLAHASTLAGDAERQVSTVTSDRKGGSSTSSSLSPRKLLPPDALRRLPPFEAVLLTGHLPPVRLGLRPWQQDRELFARATWPPQEVVDSPRYVEDLGCLG